MNVSLRNDPLLIFGVKYVFETQVNDNAVRDYLWRRQTLYLKMEAVCYSETTIWSVCHTYVTHV
jgi:hypothetical protein